MRNSTKFRDLMVEYLQSPYSKKSELINDLRKSAKKFFDYAMLFQFDRYGREEAFDKMKETYLQERYPIRVHQNVLDLFSAIDEWNEIYEEDMVDKENFLDEFFKERHEKKEDLLFYLAEVEDGDYVSQAKSRLMKRYYKTEAGMERGVSAKAERNTNMSIASLFGRKSLEILSSI